MPACPAQDGPRDLRHRDVDVLDDSLDQLERHTVAAGVPRLDVSAGELNAAGLPASDRALERGGTLTDVIAAAGARMRRDAALLEGRRSPAA